MYTVVFIVIRISAKFLIGGSLKKTSVSTTHDIQLVLMEANLEGGHGIAYYMYEYTIIVY